VHVFHHCEHLFHGVYSHSINVFIVVIAASKEPPSVARQLLVARLGGITSLNNSEVSFAIISYYKILNHIVCGRLVQMKERLQSDITSNDMLRSGWIVKKLKMTKDHLVQNIQDMPSWLKVIVYTK